MCSLAKRLIFCLALIFWGPVPHQLLAATPIKVVVDPGHGGSDHGAVYYGVKEADINLQIANLLKTLLERDSSFQPILTRVSDQNLSLEERALIANQASGDIFISLHANSFPSPKAHGVEFYFQNQLPPNEDAMYLANKENHSSNILNPSAWPLGPLAEHKNLKLEVANILQDLQLNQRIYLSSQLSESLSQNWKGNRRNSSQTIRQAPFHVISHVNMPSTLIELGYLTNKNELRQLTSPQYQKVLARSLYNGLLKYKDFIDKSLVKDLN